jgi:hypothetical protein
MLVHRRALFDSVASIKDLINGGLARLFASKIASELSSLQVENRNESDQLAEMKAGRPRRTRMSKGGSR